MKPLSIKNFIPGIIWFLVILILICTPGDELPQPRGWFQWMNLIQFDKLVHSGIFALLTFLFIRPVARAGFSKKRQWNYFLLIAFIAFIWGLVTELIQKFFIPTRSFDLIDWTADSIGVLLALLLCRYIFLRKNLKTGKL